VYFEEEPGRRAAAKLLTHDEAWRIVTNIIKLPQGAAAEATGLYRPHFRYDLNYGRFLRVRYLNDHTEYDQLHFCPVHVASVWALKAQRLRMLG
jgi:hypothetical protein